MNKKILPALKKFPWYYLLLGLYPLLFLWANNKMEISPSIVLRPLLFTLLGISLLFGILYIFFRNPDKTALLGSFLLIFFFSYGHIYYWLREITEGGLISRHRLLGPVYLVLCVAGILGLLKISGKLVRYRRMMNLVGLIMIFLPIVQLGYFYITSTIASHKSIEIQSDLHLTAGQPLPDVYYIILDTYMRADAMEQDLGYDNSPFLQELEQMGFYVATCSRSNYGYTHGSLVSSLNMDYLPVLQERFGNTTGEVFWTILVNNEVRQQFESIGYTTVAFSTPFEWSDWDDADIYLGPHTNIVGAGLLLPFDVMYIKSTAFLFINDMVQKVKSSNRVISLAGIEFPYQNHVNTVFYILDELPNIQKMPGNKFVFVHVLVPHVPYVFSPTGEILTDPGYFGGEMADAINDEYRIQGFIYAVQFINNRLIPILQSIIDNSDTPPIIIIQGDHGFRGENRFTILNAYYLPDGYEALYPSITPVNSFRTILSEYFGADYPLLPDVSYSDDGVVEETYPLCLP